MAMFQLPLFPVFDQFDGQAKGASAEVLINMAALAASAPAPTKKARKPRRAPQNVADSQ